VHIADLNVSQELDRKGLAAVIGGEVWIDYSRGYPQRYYVVDLGLLGTWEIPQNGDHNLLGLR
jgi:hypothetical protein